MKGRAAGILVTEEAVFRRTVQAALGVALQSLSNHVAVGGRIELDKNLARAGRRRRERPVTIRVVIAIGIAVAVGIAIVVLGAVVIPVAAGCSTTGDQQKERHHAQHATGAALEYPSAVRQRSNHVDLPHLNVSNFG